MYYVFYLLDGELHSRKCEGNNEMDAMIDWVKWITENQATHFNAEFQSLHKL